MKSLFITAILLIAAGSSYACEICGCGNSNFQIGILPSFNKGFIGYRYTVSSFNSKLSTDATQYSHDRYQTMELWGGHNFGRLQVMAFVPYLFSNKQSDDGTTKTHGLGDLLLLVNYKIFSTASLNKAETGSIRNELYAGGGIKLPTGVNRVDTTDPDFNIGDFNSQAGTGSVDYMINLTHNLMFARSGIVTNVAYRVNTANDQEYRFGNRAYINSAYYYSLALGTTKIKPSAGVNYQRNAVNTFAGSNVDGSNGYNLNASVGLNVLHGKIGANVTGFIPVSQNMYDGQTKLKSRTLIGVTYSF